MQPDFDDEAPTGGKETWAKLAIRLRYSRTAIVEWRKLPDAPQTPNYDEWRSFIDRMELGIAGNKTTKGREDLLKENLQKKNTLLDLEIAEKQMKMVDRSQVNQMLLRVSSLQKTQLFQQLENEMPAKAAAFGADIEEMKRLGRETAERICEIMGQEVELWTSPTT